MKKPQTIRTNPDIQWVFNEGVEKNKRIKTILNEIGCIADKQKDLHKTITLDMFFTMFGGANGSKTKLAAFSNSYFLSNFKDLKNFKITKLRDRVAKDHRYIRSLQARIKELERYEPHPYDEEYL